MEFKDYYTTLGLTREATLDEIKRAYRKLARKFHPDVSKAPDAERRFKEIGEAYAVLKAPDKRAAYDQMGSHWRDGQDFQPPPNWDAGFEFGSHDAGAGPSDEHSDFFETLFGRRARQPGRGASMRGQDHHAKVLIDLEDAYRGAQRRVTLRSPELDAQGRVSMQARSLDVRIPRGVVAGQQLRLAGQGAPGHGRGGKGDLFLEIAFNAHPNFRVDGRDVICDLPVAPWEAALGATVSAPTPDGPVELGIPPNSRSGRRLRLRGRGIPAKEAGDLYVVLSIVLPPADNDAAREAYRSFAAAFDFNPRS